MLGRVKALVERGDTIVEVMVVLAVLGLAVGISFATANSNLLAVRGAQENSQATALVQSQIEELRYLSTNTSNNRNYIFIPSPFCIDSSNDVITFGPGLPTNLNSYPPKCVSSFYHLEIVYASGTFTVSAYWNDVQGLGTDSVTLVYRLYQS